MREQRKRQFNKVNNRKNHNFNKINKEEVIMNEILGSIIDWFETISKKDFKKQKQENKQFKNQVKEIDFSKFDDLIEFIFTGWINFDEVFISKNKEERMFILSLKKDKLALDSSFDVDSFKILKISLVNENDNSVNDVSFMKWKNDFDYVDFLNLVFKK